MSIKTALSIFTLTVLLGCTPFAGVPGDNPVDELANPIHPVLHYRYKVAIFLPSRKDPWIARMENSASSEADSNRIHLQVYRQPTSKEIIRELEEIRRSGTKGAMIYPPDYRTALEIVSWSKKVGMKLILLDNYGKGENQGCPVLACDYQRTAELAAETILQEARRRKWDLSRTGTIEFTSLTLQKSGTLSRELQRRLSQAGVDSKKFLEIPAAFGVDDDPRDAALRVISRNPLVRNWIVTGFDDALPVAGLRAVQDANIGGARVIGMGIGGDGAVYDLKRTRTSGLVGSVLLPSGTLGKTAVEEMDLWISKGIYPERKGLYDPVLLNRNNVRQLKDSERLIE